MRSNHIPRSERLHQRILKLEYRLEDGTKDRSGFYPKCSHCGMSNVEQNIRGGAAL